MNNNSNEEIRERNISYLIRLRDDKKTRQYHQVIQINLNSYCYRDDLRESYDKEWALKDQAKREGIAEGKSETKKNKETEFVNQLVKDNIPMNKIKQYTGLSEDRIQEILNQL